MTRSCPNMNKIDNLIENGILKANFNTRSIEANASNPREITEVSP